MGAVTANGVPVVIGKPTVMIGAPRRKAHAASQRILYREVVLRDVIARVVDARQQQRDSARRLPIPEIVDVVEGVINDCDVIIRSPGTIGIQRAVVKPLASLRRCPVVVSDIADKGKMSSVLVLESCFDARVTVAGPCQSCGRPLTVRTAAVLLPGVGVGVPLTTG